MSPMLLPPNEEKAGETAIVRMVRRPRGGRFACRIAPYASLQLFTLPGETTEVPDFIVGPRRFIGPFTSPLIFPEAFTSHP